MLFAAPAVVDGCRPLKWLSQNGAAVVAAMAAPCELGVRRMAKWGDAGG